MVTGRRVRTRKLYPEGGEGWRRCREVVRGRKKRRGEERRLEKEGDRIEGRRREK